MRWTSIWEGDINQKLRVSVGLLFVVMGLWILFGNVLPAYLDPKLHYLMGFIFMAYGVFRIAHAEYRKNIQKQDEDEPNDDNA